VKSVAEIKNHSRVTLVFPHQLFDDHPAINEGQAVILVEEHLFFSQYRFHQTKIAFQKASMLYYADRFAKKRDVFHVKANDKLSDIRALLSYLIKAGIKEIDCIDPTDFYLEKRIKEFTEQLSIHWYENPSFINRREDLLTGFFKPSKKKFFHASFYKQSRKELNILMEQGEPSGGKWSFDEDNRQKYPKDGTPPTLNWKNYESEFWSRAMIETQEHYSQNPGNLSNDIIYPHTHEQAKQWLTEFLEQRFGDFGPYEDAIVSSESFLNHSLLSPLINSGLLNPREVINAAIKYSREHNVPINSLEGFIRQIIGWREFIRGMYESKGVASRTRNYWGFERKIPSSFYSGDTGIPPVDDAIKKCLNHSYNHHIERLMILGNFMLLCEFDPDEVYQWFMEMYIDSYDWVMVPNVYGMSQFADGGFFATKPYISSSNYILKMSDYKKGEWQKTWDSLFWRFIAANRDFFSSNPRLNMMVRAYDKFSDEKKKDLQDHAETYLSSL
jgi:deoxyribodipyrimidine photolyase-related protein